MVYGNKTLAANPLRPVSCEVGPQWIHMPQTLDWIKIWGIQRPSQHLKLVIVSLKSFLNHFFSVAACIILQREATVSIKGLVCNNV